MSNPILPPPPTNTPLKGQMAYPGPRAAGVNRAAETAKLWNE